MKSQTTDKFRKAFNDLPADIQKRARTTYNLWNVDRVRPQSPGAETLRRRSNNFMKYFLLFFLVLFIQTSFGQERINRAKATLGKPIVSITKAIGWKLDNAYRWVSRPNKIPSTLLGSDAIDYHSSGLGIANFVYLQLRKVYYGGDSNLLFIKKFKDGEFKYQALLQGWYQDYKCMYGSIKLSDWNNNILQDTIGEMSIPINLEITDYLFGKSELDIIKNNFDTIANPVFDYYLKIKYQLFPSKNIAHFILYETLFERYTRAESILEYDHDEVDGLLKENTSLSDGYYEVDYNTFKQFFLQKFD